MLAHGGARHEAEKFGVPFLGEVPLDTRIREQSDSGRPVTAVDPDGEHAKVYRAIAAKVKATLEKGRSRPPPRIPTE